MELMVKRLKQAMAEKNITVSELSRLTGIHRGTISNYRNGKYLPKQTNIYLISKALDVSPDWLMGIDGSATRDELMETMLPLVERLSPEDRAKALDYIAYLSSKSKD